MAFYSKWFGRSAALGETAGVQTNSPSVALVSDTASIGVDGALQLSTVWACIELRANTIASLPFFAYQQINGQRTLARTSRLYSLLHESPNSRMTPFEFWRAMMMNHDLRGNAYARIDRAPDGEAIALWPMPADQVECKVLDDGSLAYFYSFGSTEIALFEQDVLHLKNLGNGTTGLAKLDFMRSTTDEVTKAQTAASRTFGNGGKPTGILTSESVLSAAQREALKTSFSQLSEGGVQKLMVLEASLKYQQVSMTPEDQQLLETRNFGVEEICRWFGMPSILVNQNGVTAWGSGIQTILEGWVTLQMRPLLVNIEQATKKRVMTAKQRSNMSIEFSLDALLRGSLKDRMAIYAQATQNGIYTRNEARQLENMPPDVAGDALTAQSNLVPLKMLGTQTASGGNGSTIAQ